MKLSIKNRKSLVKSGLSGDVHSVKCPGGSHSNANVDHCGLCAPSWGELTLPVECATLEDWRKFYREHANVAA